MEEKDALLRVGRNLANFQTLEHLLKELIPTLDVHGTVSEIAKTVESTRRSIKKSSLGDLSEAFHSSVFRPLVERESPHEVHEPVFSFTMRVEASPERVKAAKARWRKLVTQRNRLVHSQLMEYDLSRSEDCTLLCRALDTQNSEITALLDELASLRANRAHAAAAMVEKLKTAEPFESEPLPPDGA